MEWFCASRFVQIRFPNLARMFRKFNKRETKAYYLYPNGYAHSHILPKTRPTDIRLHIRTKPGGVHQLWCVLFITIPSNRSCRYYEFFLVTSAHLQWVKQTRGIWRRQSDIEFTCQSWRANSQSFFLNECRKVYNYLFLKILTHGEVDNNIWMDEHNP